MEISNRKRNQYLKNAKIKLILFILCISFSNISNAQIKVSGIVLNTNNKRISLGWIKTTQNIGVIVSFKGKFTINIKTPDTLLFGCYGYKTKKLFIDKSQENLTIALKKNYLEDFTDLSNSSNSNILIKNTANNINKTTNNDKNYFFIRIEKILVNTQNIISTSKTTQINNRSFLKILKLCSTPTLFSNTKIIETKNHNNYSKKSLPIKNASISIKTFNIKNKSFEIGEANYLNPLHINNICHYKYSSEPYFIYKKDTVVPIIFRSKNSNCNPISGYTYITKNKHKVYGIYFYSTIYSHPTGIEVGQIFEYINNNTPKIKNSNLVINYHKKLSYNLWPTTIASLIITDSAYSLTPIILEKNIKSDSSKNTKRLTENLKWINNTVNRYTNNEIPISGITLRPEEFIGYNKQEEYIYGISFITNSKLSNLLQIGTKVYNTTFENKFRYNFTINTFPLINKTLQLIYKYKNQTEEIGKYNFSNQLLNNHLGFRDFLLPKVNNIKGHLLKIKYKHKNSTISLTGTNQEVIDYIDTANRDLNNFDYKSIKLSFNYKNINEFLTINNNTIPLSISYPIVNISIEQGVNKQFTRILAEINYKYWFANNKELYIKVNSGIISGTFPIQLSFNGKGSMGMPFYNFGTFQTMDVYKFFNDHFVNIFTKVSRTTTNIDNELQIKLSTQLNVGYGYMHNDKLNKLTYSNNKGFYEVGFLADLITPAINNITIGCFYNIGNYMNNSFKRDFGFVIGIRTWLKN